jgi:MFS family permease
MSLTVKRWFVLAASCLVNLCIGSIYAWSVFAKPMAAYLSSVGGAALGSLAIVFTVANSVGPITMISGGFINDRASPRFIILTGGILFGGGIFFSGFAKSLGMLIVSYGLGTGLGLGLVYGCVVANMIKFFPDHRGLVGGLVTASYGVCSVIMPPLANALIAANGVTATFKIIGAVMMILIGAASFFIIRCPPGFVPEGWTPPVAKSGGPVGAEKDWKGMLLDPIFYVMMMMLCCGAFSGLMVISQASPVAQEMIGMSAASAAVAVSFLALVNTFGRIVAGFLSDKVGVIKTLVGVFAVSMAGLIVLYVSGDFAGGASVVLFYVGISCIGLAFGAIMGIYPGFTAAQFGSKHNSVNYGIMFIGFALSGYFGPTIMSEIKASSGSYQKAFLVSLAIAAVGFLLTLMLSAKHRQSA